MKLIARGLLVLSIAALTLGAHAQQYYSYTGVTRVVKLRILPGKSADFYKYLGHAVAILKAEQSAGVILGYDIAHTVNYEGVDKYDVAVVVHYKDMAAFDTLSSKTDPIVAQHYGSPEARAAAEKMATESAEVVSSELVRNIAMK